MLQGRIEPRIGACEHIDRRCVLIRGVDTEAANAEHTGNLVAIVQQGRAYSLSMTFVDEDIDVESHAFRDICPQGETIY
jgi:hypothetical protein